MRQHVRARRIAAFALLISLALAGCSSANVKDDVVPPPSSAAESVDPKLAQEVRGLIKTAMAERDLRAVIVRITVDGKPVMTEAYGESMPGVPATVEMNFRNGAVAISYVATALLQLVDEKKVSLADKLSNWLPEVPNSDKVTLGQLAQMTSGYADYVQDASLTAAIYADPFRTWTPQELYTLGTSKPLLYTPGTNWNYSHTDYVLLGLALEKITGSPLDELLAEKISKPLGLKNTNPGPTPRFRIRCCIRTRGSAGKRLACLPPRVSWRNRRFGTRPGPFPGEPFKLQTSLT